MGHCLALPAPQACPFGAGLHFQGREEPQPASQVSVTRRTVREHPPLFLKNGRTHCKSSSPFSTFKKSPCQQGGCQCSVAISPAWVFFSPQ